MNPPSHLKKRALKIHERLLEAFGEPVWRNPLPALDELVSTILSQNTNDINRDRAFNALRAKFPAWEHVRDAKTRDVIAAIKTAGLANQKGPRIQQVLRAITEERGSLSLDFLADLPTEEGAHLADEVQRGWPEDCSHRPVFFAEQAGFPVDTHLYRVTGRIGLRPEKMTVEQAHPYLESVFPPKTYYAAHLNIIRLGREICQARKPNCPKCPIIKLCGYKPKTK